MIFCASDRMLTIGDMEMESETPKIHTATQSIVFMTSDDDAAFHAEILADVFSVVAQRVRSDPHNWWTLREAVDLYVTTREAHKRRRAERYILEPLGLNRATYVDRNKELDPDLAKQIAIDLVNFGVPNLAVIVAGIDPSGAHIYASHTNERNEIETGCYDAIGYAAIGAGARHATAEFLKAGQSW